MALTTRNASREVLQKFNSIDQEKTEYLQLKTYQEMIALSKVKVLTEVLVLNDENKTQTNTIYKLWPNGTRIWIAGVKDN